MDKYVSKSNCYLTYWKKRQTETENFYRNLESEAKKDSDVDLLVVVAQPSLPNLRDKAETLTPYAVEVRYPGETVEISQEEAQESLATTESVWNFVLCLIPGEIHC